MPDYYTVTVGAITDFGNETRGFDLRLEPGKAIGFSAGQFVAVICPREGKVTPPPAVDPKGLPPEAAPPLAGTAGGGVIRRAYSIASAPEAKGHLELLVKRVEGGVVTQWFWALKEGDRFQVHGPFGKFVLPDPVDFDPSFVAVGTGVAPFRSMIRSMLPQGFSRRIGLLLGARYDGTVPYHEEWLELARRHPNFTYIPTLSRPGPQWQGETGYVQTKIATAFPDPKGRRVYLCGLTAMIEATRKALLDLGYGAEQIFTERYD